MKTLFITLTLVSLNVFAQESCKETETVAISEKKEDVNTPTPEQLKDAIILVKTKDGKIQEMKASDFKVVPRKQQFKVRERTIVKKQECQPVVIVKQAEEKKNLLAIGARRDHTDLDARVNGNVGTLSSEKGLVLDLSYTRQQILDTPFALGVGLDTNGVLRGLVGIEF